MSKEKEAVVFVLINCEIGKERQILEEIKKVPEVNEAYLLYGVYDIIVKIKGKTNEEIREVMLSKIRRIKGIRRTLTMLVVEGFER